MMEDFLHAKGALAKFDVDEYAHANQLNLKTIEARDAYPQRASKSAKIDADMLMRLFKHIDAHVLIRLRNGQTFEVGSAQEKSVSKKIRLSRKLRLSKKARHQHLPSYSST